MEIGNSSSSGIQFASGADLFGIGAPGAASQVQEAATSTIEAQKREVNRIRGYKLQLSVAEKQKLAQIQVEIQEINQRAVDGLARPDELEDRIDLFAEADRIIGKPTVDLEADEVLADLAGVLDTLLQPRLDPARAKQVARIERVKDNLEARLNESPENRTLLQQFQSTLRIIAQLKPLRNVKELSPAEARAYDLAVEAVNDHVGVKIELSVKETRRVNDLENSIAQLQTLLPPDFSQRPTAAAVSRAYVRLAG